MPSSSGDLAEFATIELHYALAEVTSIGDRASILRALDHVQRAEASLRLVLSEYDIPPDDPEEESEAE